MSCVVADLVAAELDRMHERIAGRLTRGLRDVRAGPCPPGASGGRGQARRETPDPVAEVGYRRVEAGGIAGRDRIGDGPVHGGLAAEFLAGQVAYRDYEVALPLDVADVPGPQPGQWQPVAPGGGDRAGIDRRCRMGAGRNRRDAAGPAP